MGGYRAIVVVPLMREGELVGIFSLGRPEPDPFTQSQIKLTQTFADQAAIAIENARLFNEVKARTEDLSEALEQQTATADVLKVISRSVFDLQTVSRYALLPPRSTVRRRQAGLHTSWAAEGCKFVLRASVASSHGSAYRRYAGERSFQIVLSTPPFDGIPDCRGRSSSSPTSDGP